MRKPLIGLDDPRRPFVDVSHFRTGSRPSFAPRAGLLPAQWVIMPTPHSITPYIVPLEFVYILRMTIPNRRTFFPSWLVG